MTGRPHSGVSAVAAVAGSVPTALGLGGHALGALGFWIAIALPLAYPAVIAYPGVAPGDRTLGFASVLAAHGLALYLGRNYGRP